jgi:deoxyribonuclease-4
MASEIEGVLPCIDFAHLHARTGDGSMNSKAEWDKVFKQYRKVLGAGAMRSLHCHLSGIEYGPKGEKKHLMLEDSDFDFKGLLQALADNGCGGRILVESPTMEDDAQMVQTAWVKLAS